MTVIRDTVTASVAVAVHDGADFARACLAEYVGCGEVTPGVGKLSVLEGGAGTLRQ